MILSVNGFPCYLPRFPPFTPFDGTITPDQETEQRNDRQTNCMPLCPYTRLSGCFFQKRAADMIRLMKRLIDHPFLSPFFVCFSFLPPTASLPLPFFSPFSSSFLTLASVSFLFLEAEREGEGLPGPFCFSLSVPII
mmetsp:Transcript_12438/g.24150  ORF Transcript_12438/g.24150 Transcript_12438/m.24150 type:complete len:137 (+) Transcript_12438:217-627(+)